MFFWPRVYRAGCGEGPLTPANAVRYIDGVTLTAIADLPALPNPAYAIVGRSQGVAFSVLLPPVWDRLGK